jgi:hypothetical protein
MANLREFAPSNERTITQSHSPTGRCKFEIPLILNRDLRPALHHACVSSLSIPVSNLFISTIPYTSNIDRQFTTPIYVFSVGMAGVCQPHLAILKRLLLLFFLKMEHAKAISEID